MEVAILNQLINDGHLVDYEYEIIDDTNRNGDNLSSEQLVLEFPGGIKVVIAAGSRNSLLIERHHE